MSTLQLPLPAQKSSAPASAPCAVSCMWVPACTLVAAGRLCSHWHHVADMPEGPELHLASLYVNKVCHGLHFGGQVEKSAVSKNPEVPFSCPNYTISAVSRGKEVKLILTPVKGAEEWVVFRFGMSGSFKLTTEDDLPKHAHLRFYTRDVPRQVLSFVDQRRFGSWVYNGTWQQTRGPCVMTEYEKFRENVLKHLPDKPFDKPICEVLLNQKYFNGIGNYLRAEILFRLKIPPFMSARTALESVKDLSKNADLSLSKKVKIKKENPDLLQLCNLVPMEVVQLGGQGYEPGYKREDYTTLMQWMQCYYVPGMKSLPDHNGRTIWFQGEPGPLAPKGKKVRKQSKSVAVKSKAVKVETNATKRKATREKSISVKKECKEEVKEEAVEETAVKRTKMAENPTEDAEVGNKGEGVNRLQRGKKTLDDPEVKVTRRVSLRGAAPKTPSKRGQATKQSKDSLTPKSRTQRLKSDVDNLPSNSPKLKLRTRGKSAVQTKS